MPKQQNKEMKSALKYWIIFLLLMYFSSLFLISCKSKTTVLDQKTEVSSFKFDSTRVEVNKFQIKSLGINDLFKISAPVFITGAGKNCDSLCNLQKEKWLKDSFNMSKQSGNNGYQFLYDEMTKQIAFSIQIGETLSEKNDSIAYYKDRLKEKSEKVTEIPVKLPLTKKENFFYISGIVLWSIIGVIIIYFIIKLVRKTSII